MGARMSLLIVETPCGRDAVWAYVLDVVLGSWLGLGWRRVPSDRRDVRITLSDAPGEVRLPAVFLAQGDDSWLRPASLPRAPFSILERGRACGLVETNSMPVLFGSEAAVQIDSGAVRLPVDVFGSTFFMLSRYEENVLPDRDIHGRFPSSASVAVAAGFIEQPLIDDYVELLWGALSRIWPGLKRRDSAFRMRLTHDVDSPGKYGPAPLVHLMRTVGGDVMKRGKWGAAIRGPVMAAESLWRLPRRDPFNTFDWLMDQSEAQGVASAFYFIAGRTVPARDSTYEMEDRAIRGLIRKAHERGHEIGLHPSYGTYQQPDHIRAEADRLRRVCAGEGVVQDAWGGRMHYLRWDPTMTARAWEGAGMAYDSTLGFADRAGFRCGTARAFRMFDLVQDRALTLVQRPLIAMEGTVIGSQYMNLGYGQEAFDVFARLKQACRRVKGDFTLLWHNSHFTSPADRELYSAVLAA